MAVQFTHSSLDRSLVIKNKDRKSNSKLIVEKMSPSLQNLCDEMRLKDNIQNTLIEENRSKMSLPQSIQNRLTHVAIEQKQQRQKQARKERDRIESQKRIKILKSMTRWDEFKDQRFLAIVSYIRAKKYAVQKIKWMRLFLIRDVYCRVFNVFRKAVIKHKRGFFMRILVLKIQIKLKR